MSSQPCLADTDCIQLSLDDDGNLVATIVVSSDDGNVIECLPNGLFGTAPPVPLVATFPESPVDGQIVIYEYDTYTHWQFRYDTTESTAFKWKFIGGMPATTKNDTQLTMSAPDGTWAEGVTPMAHIILPFAGYYYAAFGAAVDSESDGEICQVGISKTGDDPDTDCWAGTFTLRPVSVSRECRFPYDGSPFALAGSEIRMMRRGTNGGGGDAHVNRRWMSIWPRKVG